MMCKPRYVLICLCWLHQCVLIGSLFFSGDKQLILVPSVAFRSSTVSDWNLYAQVWYLEENRFRAKLARTALSVVIDDIHRERLSYFTASGKKHRLLCLEGFANEICMKTDAHGLLKKKFRLSDEEVQRLQVPGETTGKIEYRVSTEDRRIQANGEIFLCDEEGISIISDIDDTIKITGVTSIRSVLRNTFSGVYQSVVGMSERYRHYQLIYNSTFHYLTASPDQLYPFLREFLDRERFPSGSYHMRHFSWFDINFFQFFLTKSFVAEKTKILHLFLEQTRSRKFILFGDIFQKDPEIYARVYQRYPERIIKIFIRVANLTRPNRLEQVFKHLPKSKWDIFVHGFDLPERIF